MGFRSLKIIIRELIGRFPENYRAMDRRKRILFFAFIGIGLAVGVVISWFLAHPSRGFAFALIGLLIAFAIYNTVVVPILVHRETVQQRRARRSD